MWCALIATKISHIAKNYRYNRNRGSIERNNARGDKGNKIVDVEEVKNEMKKTWMTKEHIESIGHIALVSSVEISHAN